MERLPFTNAPRVLVVDDDADMRLYLRGCLRAFGFQHVLEAANGEDALRLAHEPGVALVVSDVVMPGLDGLALCRTLHADAATAAIPILLVSGEPRGPSDGADGFLAKPFNAASLRAAVERLFTPPAAARPP